jgi:hypothetical protein
VELERCTTELSRDSYIYSTGNIVGVTKSRRMRWPGHMVCMEEMRNAYRISIRKSERKIPLGRPRSRREDSIKTDLKINMTEGNVCLQS